MEAIKQPRTMIESVARDGFVLARGSSRRIHMHGTRCPMISPEVYTGELLRIDANPPQVWSAGGVDGVPLSLLWRSGYV